MKSRLLPLCSLLLAMGLGVSFAANAVVGKPTVQASKIVVTNLTPTSVTLSWTNGNGENRVVFVENPSGTAAAPYDNNTYAASTDWAVKGTKIGTSNYYCVYNGTGNTVSLTNLTPNSQFSIRISEYNGSAPSEQYLTDIDINTGNPYVFYTPVAPPTVQADGITITNLTATSATLSWTKGNGENRVVFVENPSGTAAAPYNNTTYTASADWAVKGTEIGSSNYYCVYNGSGNTVTLTNLTPNSKFSVRISEYNGLIGREQYFTSISGTTNNPVVFNTPVAPPTVQANDIIVSNLTATSATLIWAKGNGEKRVVFVENPSGTAAAPYNNTTYSASADWAVKGTKIGSSNYYCVYNGSGNTVALTNLTPSSKFSVRISEYNGSVGGEQYFTSISGTTNNPAVFYTPTATGIQQTADAIALVTVSPNPTAGIVTVAATQEVKGSMTISISNLSGKQVSKTVTQQNSIDIDLTSEPTGIYMVKIEANGSTVVCKVIKK